MKQQFWRPGPVGPEKWGSASECDPVTPKRPPALHWRPAFSFFSGLVKGLFFRVSFCVIYVLSVAKPPFFSRGGSVDEINVSNFVRIAKLSKMKRAFTFHVQASEVPFFLSLSSTTLFFARPIVAANDNTADRTT